MSTILLVEDSPTQSLQMRMLLESGSHVVRCAGDGSEALEHLATGFCELVVTDLEMPTMNGLELVNRMRTDFPHIPAVLVTGRGSERLAAEALRRGAAGYVPKRWSTSYFFRPSTMCSGCFEPNRVTQGSSAT